MGVGAGRLLVPLFPLGHVLLPGAALPLRIFEPRYRRMLADLGVPGTRPAFGVVRLVTGLEVDTGLDEGEPRFARVGTLAEILDVGPQADGTFAVLAVGSQRFRVHRVVDGTTPYVQAEVDVLDEPVGEPPGTVPAAARALAGEYARLLERLVGAVTSASEGEGREPYPDDAVALSYRLAAEAPLSNDDRQELLCEPTATERLRRIQRVLRREVALLRATRTIAVPPPTLISALLPN